MFSEGDLDEEDDAVALQLELEKIRKERAEEKERQVNIYCFIWTNMFLNWFYYIIHSNLSNLKGTWKVRSGRKNKAGRSFNWESSS